MWKPSKIDPSLTLDLNEHKGLFLFAHTVGEKVDELSKQGWTFWAVNQVRGRCYFSVKVITIPTWAFKRGFRYLSWYIAHECAHAIAGHKALHGPAFMEALKSICPKEALHFETGYKPQNAMAAGISKTQGNTIAKIGKKTYDVDLDDIF